MARIQFETINDQNGRTQKTKDKLKTVAGRVLNK